MRTARRTKPNGIYHLIWRFVDRDWFFTNDTERAVYLRMLGRAISKTDWRCFTYALMSNHIHLGVIAGTSPLESWAKAVNSAFARWMNARHGRLGPLFADRPKDREIFPTKVGELIAYIHNNPVRAGCVRRAADSTWTSHRAYLGRDKHEWLDISVGLQLAGLRRASDFDHYVRNTPGESGELRLERFRRLAARRGAINVATPEATATGTIVPLVARPFATIQVDPRVVVAVVAAEFALPVRLLCSRRRIPSVVTARSVAVHAAVGMGITTSDIAAALSITKTSGSRIAKRPLPAELERVLQKIRTKIEATVISMSSGS